MTTLVNEVSAEVGKGALIRMKRGTTIGFHVKAERPGVIGKRQLTLYAVFENHLSGVHMELPFQDRFDEALVPIHELPLEALGFWAIVRVHEELVNRLLQRRGTITIVKEIEENFAVLLDISLTSVSGLRIPFSTQLLVPRHIARSYLEFD